MEKSPSEMMQFQIQEKLITLIRESEDVDSSLIRFWKPEERISEDDIWAKYDIVYSIIVKYEYPKQSKLPKISIGVCRDFTILENTQYGRFENAILLRLDPETVRKIRLWGKAAAKEVSTFFRNSELYLKEIRFDFFPENDEKAIFFIPNLPLENIYFSKKPRDRDCVSKDEYLNQKLKEKEMLENSALFLWNKNQQKNGD